MSRADVMLRRNLTPPLRSSVPILFEVNVCRINLEEEGSCAKCYLRSVPHPHFTIHFTILGIVEEAELQKGSFLLRIALQILVIFVITHSLCFQGCRIRISTPRNRKSDWNNSRQNVLIWYVLWYYKPVVRR